MIVRQTDPRLLHFMARLRFDDGLRRECRNALSNLMEALPGVRAALLVSPDGYEVATKVASAEEISTGELSAITTTITASVQELLARVECGPMSTAILEGERGTVILVSVGGVCPVGLAVVIGLEHLTLGRALHYVKDTASTLKGVLAAEPVIPRAPRDLYRPVF
ncbi:MAG: roadblock/LC7 domain-containing protein [Bryobacterales bacterium]|nr:roadblock/LC7 domain-containing protein [Acidobacteriota bacterium]MCB9384286.1 roadblock/LC7 domain-containing protein [Bryobacterales bacterium]